MFLKRTLTRWAAAAIAGASVAVLAMHAYLGSYSRFMADDYCSASVSLRLGILRAAWYWYRTWTGRYSANVLDAVFGALGPRFTPLVTSIVLISWLAVLLAVVVQLMKNVGGGGQPLVGFATGAAVLFLTLALAPDVPQALYWGQGMRSVIPPLFLITLDAAIFLFVQSRSWSASALRAWVVLIAVLAFAAGGFSETYAAMQVVAFGLALAIWLLSHRSERATAAIFTLSAGLLGALLSVIAVIASPGNPIRAAYFPPPPTLPGLLSISLNSYGLFFQSIVASPVKWIGLVSAVVFGLWLGTHYAFGPRGWRSAAFIAAVGAVLTFSCFPPAAYGESTAPPDRTLLIPTYILVIAAVLFGIAASEPLSRRWKSLPGVSFAAVLLVWAVAVMSFAQLFSGLPAYVAYASAWNEFHTQLVADHSAGVPEATIATSAMNANNWAGLNVLGDNPKFWLNKCVSDYYGVRVISSTP